VSSGVDEKLSCSRRTEDDKGSRSVGPNKITVYLQKKKISKVNSI
jgi:hypothetical protein